MNETEDIKITNQLLRLNLAPNNIQSYTIKFNYQQNEVIQNINQPGSYNLFKLVNPSVIGSSSWLNISNSIGNNKFSCSVVDNEIFKQTVYKRGIFIKNKSIPDNINGYSFYPYENYNSLTRNYQKGSIDNNGVFQNDPSGIFYCQYPNPTPVYAKIKIVPLNKNYKFKISIFDYTSQTGISSFNAQLSETEYYNTEREINTVAPTYLSPGFVTVQNFLINVSRIDNDPINPSELSTNICNILSLNDTYNTVVSELQTIPIVTNKPNLDLYIQYGNTYDYRFSLDFFKSQTGNNITAINLPDNNTNEIETSNLGPGLEGSIFYIKVECPREFNQGDLNNIQNCLKSLSFGKPIDIVTIPDGFYSGIYNSLPNTNPLNFGWEYIKNLLLIEEPELEVTLNPNLTINYANKSSEPIQINFYGNDLTSNSNRFFGFYNLTYILIKPDSFITSPNPIDLDSDGRFDKIAISYPYLSSIGYIGELNNIIYLQKGSNYLQNISNNLPFYKKMIGTRNIDQVRFLIVDGKNKPILLNDSLLFTCEIEVYKIAEYL